MSRWFEHPCTSKLLEGDQVLTVLSFINEAKDSFKTHYGDPTGKESPLDDILKLWPDKSNIKREWLRRVLDNGPMHDKIQSMGTIITEFPMHSLFYLDLLIAMVNLNKKRFAIISVELLSRLFVTYLLPKGRPLININERPLATLTSMKNEASRKKNLCFWYFEEQLKVRYNRFLTALEDLLKNEPDTTNKIKLIKHCVSLCQSKEAQTTLIDMVVNKLGDQNRKVAGCAFSKTQTLGFSNHILLAKIVGAIRRFVFRPNVSRKAQHYSAQLLAHCQLRKGPHSDGVATEIVQIYIGLFKRLIDERKSRCEKLYAALLCGMSRALPFAANADLDKHTDTLFKLVHSSNLNLATRGLKVLLSVVTATADEQKLDRYFRLVYSTILNPAALFNSQKIALVDVFFRSVGKDSDSGRVKAMLKRLLQLCLVHPEPGFVCVCLLFLSRLYAAGSKHQGLFTLAVEKPAIAVGDIGAEVGNDDDSSGEEELQDIESDNDGDDDKPEESVEAAKETSWMHYNNRLNNGADDDSKETKKSSKPVGYDPLGRNPKYANAENERFVELDLLCRHFHPSVRIFAGHVVKMEKIPYDSDPSVDLSLASFLDKFAYKQPKKSADDSKLPTSMKVYSTKTATAPVAAVNTKEFADLNAARVPLDQRFFHQYFNHAKLSTDRRRKPTDDGEEIDSDFDDSDTEFDAFLMKENEDNDGDELILSGSEMSAMSDCDLDGLDDSDMSMELDDDEEEQQEEEEEDDDDNDEVMLHSSKRQRLGDELATITTGAMSLGKTFDDIQDRATDRIKSDRKKRKTAKNKLPNAKVNVASKKNKLGKRKLKK